MPSEDLDKDKFARSFGSVVDSYQSARPDYPADAAEWLVRGEGGSGPHMVLELGAGTGLLSQRLTGHKLLATDPSPQMLGRLRDALPGVPAAVAAAEHIPLPSHAVDVVVAAQAFHWFDHEVALPEIARVLRPDGHLALVWNVPDEGTPWVRKLQRIVPRPMSHDDDIAPLHATPYFGAVEEKRFRIWTTVDKQKLLDLVKSRSPYAVADQATREQMLADVGALYDDYDRGTAGMQLPYITYFYRAKVQRQPAARHGAGSRGGSAAAGRPPGTAMGSSSRDVATPAAPEAPEARQRAVVASPPVKPPEDDGTLLIDFR